MSGNKSIIDSALARIDTDTRLCHALMAYDIAASGAVNYGLLVDAQIDIILQAVAKLNKYNAELQQYNR